MTAAEFHSAGLYDPAAPEAPARVSEAAVALFLANIEAPIVARGAGELALAQANLRAVNTLDTIPNAVRAMFRAQMEVAIRRLRSARPERAMQDTVRLTVGFVDLVGYTRLSQQLDARALGALVERFEALASDAVAARDGRLVKLVGDAVMFVAVGAGAACDIALTLLERFADDPAVAPRGGLAEGRLLARGGDYYGPAVNLAARIGELAVPREDLVTAAVAGVGRGRGAKAPVSVLRGREPCRAARRLRPAGLLLGVRQELRLQRADPLRPARPAREAQSGHGARAKERQER